MGHIHLQIYIDLFTFSIIVIESNTKFKDPVTKKGIFPVVVVGVDTKTVQFLLASLTTLW